MKSRTYPLTLTLLALCLAGPLLSPWQNDWAQAKSRAMELYESASANMGKRVSQHLALSQINEALKLEPGNPSIHHLKAAVLAAMDEYEEALPCIETALKLDPKNSKSWLRKAEILHNLKRNDEALACFDKATNLWGKPLKSSVKADILIGMGRFADAEKELDHLIATDPAGVNIRGKRADICIYTGQWSKAIVDLTFLIAEATKHQNSFSELLRKRATCYTHLKQYSKGIEDYKSAIKINPDYRDLHTGLMNCYSLAGDSRAAQAEKKYLDSLDKDLRLYR
jgi:tetratricopeptide (TPR) repeat protein